MGLLQPLKFQAPAQAKGDTAVNPVGVIASVEREREATRGAELVAERRMRGRVKLRLGTAAEAAPDLGGRRGEGGWGTATDARGGRAAEVGDAGTAACGVDASPPPPSWS